MAMIYVVVNLFGDESKNRFVSLNEMLSFCLVQTNIVYCWMKTTTSDCACAKKQ